MKRFLRLLGHGLYVTAWLIVLVTVGTLILEKGPWLRDALRGRLAEELGALGPALSIDEVRIHWLKPALELRRVRLERQEGELVLDSIYVALDPSPSSEQPLRFVRVRGGRLDVYESLYDDVREVLRTRSSLPSPGKVAQEVEDVALPPIVIEGVELGFVTPRFGRLPIGEVGGRLEFGADGPTLQGEILPSFREAGSDASIQFLGRVTGEVISVRAACPGVALSLESDRYQDVRELLPIRDPRGVLRLSGGASLLRDGSAPPKGEFLISIDECSFAPRGPLPSVEALDLELAAAFDPGEEGGLFSTDAWSISGRFEGRTFDTPLSGWVRAGVAAENAALEGWAHAPALPLGNETLTALRDNLGDTPSVQVAEEFWRMFEPEGRADAALAVRVRRPWDPIEAWDVVADLRLDDGLRRAAWFGKPERPGGEREGIPLPVEDFTGRLVYARTPGRPPVDRFAIVDVNGRHATGTIQVAGVVSTAEAHGYGPDVEIEIQVPGIDVDPNLLAAFGHHHATARVPLDYAPLGGRASGTIRLQGGERVRGLTAALDVSIEGAQAQWLGLPVPVRDVDGELHLRWAEEPTLRPDGERGHRPVGVSFQGGGRFGSGDQQRVSVGVLYREAIEAGAVVEPDVRLPHQLTVDVDIDHLFLRGADWETIVATLPEVKRQVDAYQPLGWTDVRFRYGEPWIGGPDLWEAEITPGDLEIVPAMFPRPTTDVRGRVLVRGETEPPASEGAGPGTGDGAAEEGRGEPGLERRTRASSVVGLAGTWLQDAGPVEVAAQAFVPEEGEGRAEVYAAGIDPTNKALLGSLKEAMEAQGRGRGLDLSALAVDGFLDFAGELPLLPYDPAAEERGSSRAPEPAGRYNVFLRSNDLVAGDFRLSRMKGVLVQEDGILRGDRIDAYVGSTPVTLESAHFLGTKDLPRLPGARERLAELGVSPERDGYLLTSAISARAPLPMDEEHLGLFFDEDALRTVLDRAAIRGTLSFEDATFVLTSDGLGQGRIAVGGPVRVRDMGVLLGLPIEIDQGDLEIHSLVFEAGQVRGWIDVNGVRGSIADRAIRDTSLMLTYVNGRLSIDQLDAQFDFGGEYDGRLTSLGAEAGGGRALAIDLGEPYEFELNLELQKVMLDGLLRGLFDTGFNEPGRVNATLNLRGQPSHLNQVSGSGHLRLYEARLWSIPVARELFSRLGFDETATFQEMRTRFDVADGELRLSGMLAKSPLARLAGRGVLDLDGTLHVDLEVRYRLLDNLGPLNQLLYRIQNSLLRVAIRGDLARPFVILRNSFVELFRGFEDHPRALPLPPFRPLPERF